MSSFVIWGHKGFPETYLLVSEYQKKGNFHSLRRETVPLFYFLQSKFVWSLTKCEQKVCSHFSVCTMDLVMFTANI